MFLETQILVPRGCCCNVEKDQEAKYEGMVCQKKKITYFIIEGNTHSL